jgi:hypothetical protein
VKKEGFQLADEVMGGWPETYTRLIQTSSVTAYGPPFICYLLTLGEVSLKVPFV